MRVPGVPSLIFLFFLLVLLPWAALRSAKRVKGMSGGPTSLPASMRSRVLFGTILTQAFLLAIAWLTARDFGYRPFAVSTVDGRAIGMAILALAVTLVMRQIARATRSEAERRTMFVYRMAPRTGGEAALFVLVAIMAGVAEEAAYRGVAVQILWYSLGSQTAAILISALAFTVAHATQGWKSGVVIFGIALVMHALVAFSGTLVLAMIVHTTYDLIAGYRISREAKRFDQQDGNATAIA